ncbi:MAG: hypothetical protein MJE77_23805 [Proteobacteria bacterium]|nr:hypothetical protein [Pseudomonadota bacterium]
MPIAVEIFKGDRKLDAPVCCGAEVTSSFMSSCCGTQDIPDDTKIAFLHTYIREDNWEDKVNVDVNDISEGGEALEHFWRHCEASGISRDTDIAELLPIVVIDSQVKFIGRIPTGDEFMAELEAIAEKSSAAAS